MLQGSRKNTYLWKRKRDALSRNHHILHILQMTLFTGLCLACVYCRYSILISFNMHRLLSIIQQMQSTPQVSDLQRHQYFSITLYRQTQSRVVLTFSRSGLCRSVRSLGFQHSSDHRCCHSCRTLIWVWRRPLLLCRSHRWRAAKTRWSVGVFLKWKCWLSGIDFQIFQVFFFFFRKKLLMYMSHVSYHANIEEDKQQQPWDICAFSLF